MLTRWLSHFKDPIMLQATEESLYYSIVPASPYIAHAGSYAIAFEQLREALARVLRTTITMKYQQN